MVFFREQFSLLICGILDIVVILPNVFSVTWFIGLQTTIILYICFFFHSLQGSGLVLTINVIHLFHQKNTIIHECVVKYPLSCWNWQLEIPDITACLCASKHFLFQVWVSDCCLTTSEQFFSFIMERTSYILIRWCTLYTSYS